MPKVTSRQVLKHEDNNLIDFENIMQSDDVTVPKFLEILLLRKDVLGLMNWNFIIKQNFFNSVLMASKEMNAKVNLSISTFAQLFNYIEFV